MTTYIYLEVTKANINDHQGLKATNAIIFHLMLPPRQIATIKKRKEVCHVISTRIVITCILSKLKVAVTACVSTTQKFSDHIVKFSTVNFQVGINNLYSFKSSGKFVCEIPGLYYISAQIRTRDDNYDFCVRKNGKIIASSRSDSGDTLSANPISAVVELQLKDTLYVYAFNVRIGSYSCLSIMKVN
ncbi:unnamed protein product [Mytilus coruscus]|uniref:C1q domain-containing protein n=1 Tax=Mytilus coruscus TaxID=42192 RepID=A0A6J8CL43_MYTCO|nr:unnamed protein product [Mytilus coruscus]